MRSISAIVALIGAGLLSTAPQARQVALPAFRTGVDVVHVDVSVLDRQRKPVEGLMAADFTVLEDGKRVEVVAFAAVAVPSGESGPAAAWTRNIVSDVVSNDLPRDGRLVVILFDQTIRRIQQPLARRVAEAIVDRLGPNDLAAVVHTTSGTPQNFTADRARLRAAIDAPFDGLADSEAMLQELQAMQVGVPSARSQAGAPGDAQRGQCPLGLCTLETITRIAETLRDLPRRKTLVFIGGAIAIQEFEWVEVKRARERMFRALDVANLTVHAVDPTGLETLAADASLPSGGRPRSNRTALMQTNLKRQLDLSVVPARTGGRTIVNANDPDLLMKGVLDESRSYYTLAFRSKHPPADGSFHEISVKVDRPGVQVHARKGFYATGGHTSGSARIDGLPVSLSEILTSGWPRSDIAMRVAAQAFAHPGSLEPVVAVVASADTVDSPELEAVAAAFDSNGESANYLRQTLSVKGTSTYEILSPLPLQPGRYEIRTALVTRDGKTGGSAFAYVDVPDFRKAEFAVSGLVLEVVPGPPAAPVSAFTHIMPIVPTARREFAPSDRVRAFCEIYQHGASTPQPADVRLRIQDAASRVVVERQQRIAPEQLDADRTAEYLLELPTDTLAAGQYLMSIEINSANRKERRDVRFSIR